MLDISFKNSVIPSAIITINIIINISDHFKLIFFLNILLFINITNDKTNSTIPKSVITNPYSLTPSKKANIEAIKITNNHNHINSNTIVKMTPKVLKMILFVLEDLLSNIFFSVTISVTLLISSFDSSITSSIFSFKESFLLVLETLTFLGFSSLINSFSKDFFVSLSFFFLLDFSLYYLSSLLSYLLFHLKIQLVILIY